MGKSNTQKMLDKGVPPWLFLWRFSGNFFPNCAYSYLETLTVILARAILKIIDKFFSHNYISLFSPLV